MVAYSRHGVPLPAGNGTLPHPDMDLLKGGGYAGPVELEGQ